MRQGWICWSSYPKRGRCRRIPGVDGAAAGLGANRSERLCDAREFAFLCAGTSLGSVVNFEFGVNADCSLIRQGWSGLRGGGIWHSH
jgi:hypothetical protein